MKSRNLSIYNYFQVLQQEYVVAELRSKIYPRKKDKEYYERVMEAKKEKILNIAERNMLPNIFNNTDVKNRIYESIYGAERIGLPEFLYSSDEHKEATSLWDKRNYYAAGAEFRTANGEIGVLETVDVEVNFIGTLKTENGDMSVSLHLIGRIL